MSKYKSLRVPEDAWEEAKAQKEEHGRTWGEQIVRPNGSEDDSNGDVSEQLDRIESAARAAESAAQNAEQAITEATK